MRHFLRITFAVTIIFVLFAVVPAAAQGKLTVKAGKFYPVHGKVIILVYDSTVSSMDSKYNSKAIRRYTLNATSSECTVTIDDLKKGRYAIEVIHDVNEDGKLEFLHEDYGFSGRGNTGNSKFRTTSIYFNGDNQEIFIPLENELANSQQVYKNKVAFNPVFGYAPETSMLLGANMFRLFRHKAQDTLARTSYMDALAVGTLHKQVILEQNYLIFTREEKWMINGFTGFLKFPQSYYGVGNHDTRGKETVNYMQFRFEHLLMHKVYKKLFAGIGYRYTNLFNVRYGDESRFVTTPTAGSNGAVTSGVQLAVASDNRNNVYNTSSGHLIRVKATFNSRSLASGFNYNAYEIDIRKFFKPFVDSHDVVAFQIYSYFSAGNVPWSEMGALGSDMIMRGYYSGKYRDRCYSAAQVEYRKSFNKLLGAVVFAGLGEVSDKVNDFSAHYLKPNYGVGGRLALDRKERLNLRLDLGFGQKTSNIYFTLAEAF